MLILRLQLPQGVSEPLQLRLCVGEEGWEGRGERRGCEGRVRGEGCGDERGGCEGGVRGEG